MAEAGIAVKVLVELDREDAERLKRWAYAKSRAPFADTYHRRLFTAVDLTQQQFDLSSFRKEVERQLKDARELQALAARKGWDDADAEAGGEVDALEGVLALLPGGEAS